MSSAASRRRRRARLADPLPITAIDRRRLRMLLIEEHRRAAGRSPGVAGEIEEALERMLEGRYGWCESCGTPIGLWRLNVVPYARRCTTC